MLKKLIISAVVISLPLALAGSGGRGMRPAPQRSYSGGALKPSESFKPQLAPAGAYRPQSVTRPDDRPSTIRPQQRPERPSQPKPPQQRPERPPTPKPPPPQRPGNRPPPPPPPPAWGPGYYYSDYVPVVPAVYYGDIPSDYTYAWYNNKYVLCWRGWFWYNNAWVWGGQGAAPAPPNWRPR